MTRSIKSSRGGRDDDHDDDVQRKRGQEREDVDANQTEKMKSKNIS